MTQANT